MYAILSSVQKIPCSYCRRKLEPEILSFQILKCCRVLYLVYMCFSFFQTFENSCAPHVCPRVQNHVSHRKLAQYKALVETNIKVSVSPAKNLAAQARIHSSKSSGLLRFFAWVSCPLWLSLVIVGYR